MRRSIRQGQGREAKNIRHWKTIRTLTHTQTQTNRLINSSDEHTHIIRRSRLERKYKLLYKSWDLSMGEGDFRPPQLGDPTTDLHET